MSYAKVKPNIADGVFVAESADVIGKVTLKEGSSVWFHAVLRGDADAITVGEGSNVQDNVTVHCSAGHGVSLGKNVTVGHNAIVHGASVGDNVLIGMGAVILDGAVIGENSIIAAAALVSEGKEIPPNSLVLGVPGKVVRRVSEEEAKGIAANAAHYTALAAEYRGE